MTRSIEAEFVEAVHSQERVTGQTHEFYRYPARFSPLFARAAIRAFTRHGDLVFDPFMGGGTTLVEARALGRRAIGTDISGLAVFVSRVKTTLLSEDDVQHIRDWAKGLRDKLNLHEPVVRPETWIAAGYQRNISGKSTWRIRKTLELALAQIDELPRDRQQQFARCALLKTSQWALDSRVRIPAVSEFRQRFFENLERMTEDALEYAITVQESENNSEGGGSFDVLCLHRSAAGAETEEVWQSSGAPALILTSPPYPSVHVLYHRWQVQGRKETPAPFWIANELDGNGASFYTFADRGAKDLTGYYEKLRACFISTARIVDQNTMVIQMVAFANPSTQLERYLEVMEDAGFAEIRFPEFSNSADGRLWRWVPNRKWYADQKGATAASREVVLFHRQRGQT